MKNLNKLELAIIGAIAVIVTGTFALAYLAVQSGTPPGGMVACTAEAKQCPDGRYVGREGPNCEFAPCRAATSTDETSTSTDSDENVSAGNGGEDGILPYQSGIRGTVLLGPTCPVERNPPDPGCADRPYATSVTVVRKGSQTLFAITKSDTQGRFEFSLPPGDYTISAKGGEVMPTCQPLDVTVDAAGYASANIVCDTGIR